MDKQSQNIQSMFSKIYRSYDLVNSLLSFGIHHLWKKELVNRTDLKSGDSVLDCATGTGDLALLYKIKVGGKGKVTGCDFSREMLSVAPQKARKKNLPIVFEWADVTRLPYKNNEFNAVSISFGIRNVDKPAETLREMARVTVSGGQVMILEFGQVQVPVFREIYNFYSKKILPFVGGVISGNLKAYQYLNQSSLVFPCGEDFKREILATGLYRSVSVFPLSHGITFIYKCVVK